MKDLVMERSRITIPALRSDLGRRGTPTRTRLSWGGLETCKILIYAEATADLPFPKER